MLLQLRIRDFAIIDEVELDIPPGFTVFTGETGAGKSIVVDALSLALGGRASPNVVRTGASAALVEALFDITSQPIIKARLEQRDLVGDDPDSLLVRRTIGAKGRGKVLINGHLATRASLAEIVRGLVDISGQHEQQSLLITDNHLEILDAYGGLDTLKVAYRDAYEAMRTLQRERERLAQSEDATLRQLDFLRFELEEIERLAPQLGEDESLESERKRLGHAEKLHAGSMLAEALLYSDDGSVFDKLGKASAEVESLARIDEELLPVVRALDAAQGEIEDAARVLQRYGEAIESDPMRLEEVDGRLADLRRLLRKHGGSIEDVLDRRDTLREELETLEHSDARLAELEGEVLRAEEEVVVAGRSLHQARKDAAKKLSEAIQLEVGDMDLEGAVFCAELTPRDRTDGLCVGGRSYGPNGGDDLEFMWSANRGETPRPLAKIASGGELSRLMLAVKSILANNDLVSLYVFDEVDTGLGGRAADKIGAKIQGVAEGHQAITITHLAPIAARADRHLRVRKLEQGGRTISILEPVEGTARADELARMIDGATISKATRQAAKEMLARCRRNASAV